MVWIYGGGYAEGDKTLYNPEGLIDRSEARGEEIVYVAMNYRVSLWTVLSYPLVIYLILNLVGRIRLAGWE